MFHSVIKEAVEGLKDCLFPPVCVHCGECVEMESPLRALCIRCALEIHRVERPACERCGFPFFGVLEGSRACPHCSELEVEFEEGRTMVLFRGPARSLMLDLKYRRGVHVLPDIGRLASECQGLGEWIEGALLVPVPLHPRKRRERGYNQTELIVEQILAAHVGRAGEALLLERVVDGASQTSMDREERMGNLSAAFGLKKGAVVEAERRHILVDDVFTTGSTLNRCAGVLRKAGAQRIDVLSFGHG